MEGDLLQLSGAVTTPLTATSSGPFFLQLSRLCLGRANYCQSPDPGIKLRPWRQVSLGCLCPPCRKASPSCQRRPPGLSTASCCTLASVGSSLYTAAASLSVPLPGFNFPTLLLEENFKS